MPDLASTLRILQPAPNIIAFYDGRVPGVRACSDKPNWLDDGAYELGVCTYAIVSGSEALLRHPRFPGACAQDPGHPDGLWR